MGNAAHPVVSLDHRGRSITTFVVFDAAQRMAELEEGQELEILTDEFEPFEHDIAAWCAAVGHLMLVSESTEKGHRFVIGKGAAAPTGRKLALVLSADGLLELLSPLAFSLAAALEGVDVHVYLQGPAVRVASSRYRPRIHGWGRPFSRFAARGLAKAGHVEAQEKLRQLRTLGAHLYLCGGSMQPFKVRREDLIFDDVPIVEYLTFMSVMKDADIQLYV